MEAVCGRTTYEHDGPHTFGCIMYFHLTEGKGGIIPRRQHMSICIRARPLLSLPPCWLCEPHHELPQLHWAESNCAGDPSSPTKNKNKQKKSIIFATMFSIPKIKWKMYKTHWEQMCSLDTDWRAEAIYWTVICVLYQFKKTANNIKNCNLI